MPAYIAGTAILSLMFVGTFTYSMAALAAGFVVAGAFAMGLAIAWAGTLTAGVEGRLRRRKSGALRIALTTRGPARAVIPYSKVMYWGYGAAMSGFALAFAGAAAGMYASEGGLDLAGAVVLAIPFLFFVSFPVCMALGKFALGRVEVSPEGVYQRGWTFESYVPWEEIYSVRPTLADGPTVSVGASGVGWQKRQILKIWKQDKLPTAPSLDIPARNLAVDGHIVYLMIHHYFTRPADRAELGSHAAVERAQTGRFASPTGA